MKNIITYANGHHYTQLARLSTSAAGVGALHDMQQKLDFAGEEIKRMEDEGGIPLDDEQTKKLDAYSRLTRHIKKVLRKVRSSIENL